jgi:multiple sugar transport system permease protein
MAVVRTPAERIRDRLAVAAVIAITIVMLAPIYWIASTAFKPRSLATTVPPTVFFKPEITPFIKLFTKRVQLLRPVDKATYDAAPWWERLIYDGGERVLKVGGDPQLSAYPNRFLNSLIVAISSTFLAVAMGTITAYGFSRFRIAGEPDLLFFILSTRMLPPVVVAIPMFLMYRQVGLVDTHLGLIILYTAFNLSFSVWLMKGFIDEIPKEYEEAALVDGYTRLQAFLKIVIPESSTGIAATAVFCFITAWNEYAFALMMTNRNAQTAPPFIPAQLGSGLTAHCFCFPALFLLSSCVTICCAASHSVQSASDDLEIDVHAPRISAVHRQIRSAIGDAVDDSRFRFPVPAVERVFAHLQRRYHASRLDSVQHLRPTCSAARKELTDRPWRTSICRTSRSTSARTMSSANSI